MFYVEEGQSLIYATDRVGYIMGKECWAVLGNCCSSPGDILVSWSRMVTMKRERTRVERAW